MALLERVPNSIILRILEFSTWKDRANWLLSSKKTYIINDSDQFYLWCCNRLSLENGIYFNDSMIITSWHRLFHDSFHLREMWVNPTILNENTIITKHKINVFARFRPKAEYISDSNDNKSEGIQVNLPLHQRLALIKMSNKLKSNKEALQVLKEEGEWFDQKWKDIDENMYNGDADLIEISNDSTDNNSNDDNHDDTGDMMKVKPSLLSMNDINDENMNNINNIQTTESSSTLKNGHTNINTMYASVQTVDQDSGKVVVIAPDVGLREFNFNGVFPPFSSQKLFYQTVAQKLVLDFINGYNTTAIVYGQTGSGKTYSMFGKEHSSYSVDKPECGIIPRTCQEVLEAMKFRQKYNQIESQLAISYVEIFGDQIFDLLRQGTRCGHSKVAAQKYVLSGAAERIVHTYEDIEEILYIGERQKRYAATAMNERSSRAHTVFILSLVQTKTIPNTSTTSTTMPSNDSSSSSNIDNNAIEPTMTITRKSKFFLADLGGSEQVKKSLINEQSGTLQTHGFEKGDRMREAVYINLGLLALKKCVEGINTQASYIPYQDSKLTMLLSEGLGGNSKTSIIVCASMDPIHATESVSTLRFGEKCAQIENIAHDQVSMLEAVLADIDIQIKQYEELIKTKETWKVQEIVRIDPLAAEGTLEAGQGGKEVIRETVLVGAEYERQQLIALLQKRATLTSSTHMKNKRILSNDTTKDVSSSSSSSSSTGADDMVTDTATTTTTDNDILITASTGFGGKYAELYGFGKQYKPEQESLESNERFSTQVKEEYLPKVIKQKGKKWISSDELQSSIDPSTLEKKAKKVNRNKLVYSGLS